VAPTTDHFEETFAELRKWADVNSPKYLLLTVKREKRAGRLGSALKVCNFYTLSSVDFVRNQPLVSPSTVSTIEPHFCCSYLVVATPWEFRLSGFVASLTYEYN